MRVLVVGQGLAGTLVSHFALRRSWDVQVIDAGYPSASSVAAGMYNPMSFRRIVEVWEAEAHLRIMEDTFRDIEQIVGLPLLHPLPIHKCLPNADYAAAWAEKAQESPWIDAPSTDLPGRGAVKGGGWVDMNTLLNGWRERLIASERFTTRPMAPEDTTRAEGGEWDAIIDCRGNGMREQPHSIPLDIRANRGELMTITVPEGTAHLPPEDVILNFGKWTIPLGGHHWRLGASYEWNRMDLDPTPETARFLLEALSQAIGSGSPWEIRQHACGIRPVSRDRRPAVGHLPGRQDWFVLNGLGTRGVLIGPRWARHLVDIVAKQSTENPDTQPSRLILR